VASFSQQSQDGLDTCHTDLIVLFEEVVKHFDCKVICGHRAEQEQMAAYLAKATQTKWPESRHNSEPSMAADVAPYPIDWNDRERFTLFAGYVLGIASALKAQGRISYSVRWGGDWNSNTQVSDNKFDDLVHFELA
jgi:peptidoglycan L-alanyl-D-glutamate endopeptidase CwlK